MPAEFFTVNSKNAMELGVGADFEQPVLSKSGVSPKTPKTHLIAKSLPRRMRPYTIEAIEPQCNRDRADGVVGEGLG
jgi:hypothetical protein